MSQKKRSRQRKRTELDPWKMEELKNLFTIKWRQTTKEVSQISVQLDLEREVVRVWFCNRRQKDWQQKQATGRRQSGSELLCQV